MNPMNVLGWVLVAFFGGFATIVLIAFGGMVWALIRDELRRGK